MIPGLQEILVVSDMDGTLLSSEAKLLRSNLEMVRLFTMLGGNFTIATGRVAESMRGYPELAKVMAPGITSGGCVLYDFRIDMPLKSAVLPKMMARKALLDIREAFPKAGAVVFGADCRQYQVYPSAEAEILFAEEEISYLVRPEEALPADWNKLLFAAPPQTIREMMSYVDGRNYPGTYFVAASPIYLELMPQGVSRGNALFELCELLRIPVKNTIVIGGHHSDIDMMKKAGYAVAMQNAPKEVCLVADEVTALNDDGGVGQFLYKLIKQHE